MDSFIKILYYLDIPATLLQELIEFYRHCVNSESTSTNSTRCDLNCTLSDETKKTLIANLLTDSYGSAYIIKQIQLVYKNKHGHEERRNIFNEAFTKYFKLFTSSCNDDEIVATDLLYTLLSSVYYCCDDTFLNDDQRIYSHLCQFVENGRLQKEFLYLTLLQQQNHLQIIRRLLEYERQHFNTCDLNDFTSLIRYCLYKNRHWLYCILEDNCNNFVVDEILTDKIWILKLIYTIINDSTSATENALKYISKINLEDKFVQFFVTSIKWYYELYRSVVVVIIKQNVCFHDLLVLNVEPCLKTLSLYIDFTDFSNYNIVNDILRKHELYIEDIKRIQSDSDVCLNSVSEMSVYNGFCLLLLIYNYILLNNDEEEESIEDQLKTMKVSFLLSTDNNNCEFLVQVFNYVYNLLFFQNDDDRFVCDEIRFYNIVMFLQTTLKELKKRKYANSINLIETNTKFKQLNDQVNEMLWRFDLLQSENVDYCLMDLMVSPPNTLVHLCLENNSFEKAHQIVQVFNMHNTYIAEEVEFMEKLKYFKQNEDVKTISHIIQFYLVNDEKNDIFFNLIDATLMFKRKLLLDGAFNHQPSTLNNNTDYMRFCNHFKLIFDQIKEDETGSIIRRLLQSSSTAFNVVHHWNELNESYNTFQLQVENLEQETCYSNIMRTLDGAGSSVNYLQKLYNYLMSLQERDNSCMNSIFDLMKQNVAQIIGKLFFQPNNHIQTAKQLEQHDFIQTFNFDLIYQIACNCVSIINLHHPPPIQLDEDDDQITFDKILVQLKQSYSYYYSKDDDIEIMKPDLFLLSYIRKRNYLLAYIINKIHLIHEEEDSNNSDRRTRYFTNLLNLPRMKKNSIFKKNTAITVLYDNNIPIAMLLSHLQMVYNDGENKWKLMLDIMDSLPSAQLLNKRLQVLKDAILYHLVPVDPELVKRICNTKLRIKCTLENLTTWPANVCLQILKAQLLMYNEQQPEEEECLKNWYSRIELYEDMKDLFGLCSWNEMYIKSEQDPETIFLLLLTSKQIKLLLKWIELHNRCESINNNLSTNLINVDYFVTLLLNEQIDLIQVKSLLDLLQFNHRIHICKHLLKSQLLLVKQFNCMEFIIRYLVKLLPELESEYRNTIIALKIISCFTKTEQDQLVPFIHHKPLLIIEQLIMNTRLEKLNQVLKKIRPIIMLAVNDDDDDDGVITINSVDLLIRKYAKKSLDFNGIQLSGDLKSSNLKLMQSLDTLTSENQNVQFIMPQIVPHKSVWIANEKAMECMCCDQVIFSMFNRRHHCRRCGRVVCGNCSYKRMQIAEYGSIPVRVCNDCYIQSQQLVKSDSNDDVSSSSSSKLTGSNSNNLDWLLTDNDEHNEIAREEFSFEYAPSVSLCLSILKLHSQQSIEYPRFLLDQCKTTLLPHLHETDSEIDFSFLIQMIKSLITVAKMICLNNSFKMELSQCNEMLTHIELLNLLVEKDCLNLIRSSNNNNSSSTKTKECCYNIDASVLRRVRDKLLEQEQWQLALEVSMKAGLDKTGVFAAWGKSCLKTGSLPQARHIFQHCFQERTPHFEQSFSLSLSSSVLDDSSKSFNDDVRIKKTTTTTTTPPLVNEIISVLESLNNMKTSSSNIVLDKLNNLKNITSIRSRSGRKNSKIQSSSTSSSRRVYYNECLYYLRKYGSHSSTLHFHLRHDEIEEALAYILQNQLQPDDFIDVYMTCLNMGKIEKLQQALRKIDSTLHPWEIHLKGICRHLELHSMFNVLYDLQQFMCDYVRAAMTCIRYFYKENTNNFQELQAREIHLQRAARHLKQQLEQEHQWIGKRKISTTSSSSSSSSMNMNMNMNMKIEPRNIDKYINTIWRQIEVCKFLSECECEGRPTFELLHEMFATADSCHHLPTLFDTQMDKMKLATLAVVCGRNVEQGFGIAFRIIQDHNLKYSTVYNVCGKYLAEILRDDGVVELISCIRSSGLSMKDVDQTCDQLLIVAITTLTKANNATGMQLDKLIQFITDVATKINAYIESKQLKRAYLLAVKYNRNNDIRKILREAERQNQAQIKAICIKRLNQLQ